jgi:dTDP-4-amino-4,6-dideoxygalactose transaminase
MHFIDLKAQQDQIRPLLDQAIKTVLDHGQYIMGPEIQTLEDNLADYCGAKFCLSCSSGTDALVLALMAKNIGPGDAVFVPSFTFAATAEVVVLLGATPVFVDILPDTFNIDPDSLALAIERAKEQGLTPKTVIAVDLFGLPADYDVLHTVAEENGLWVLGDSAQGFGGSYKGRKLGSCTQMTATSFFPAKPLGCYGDGGALFTDDVELYHILKSLRVHGAGDHRYDQARIGINGRLDTLQAAILIEKLKIFPQELENRQVIAQRYNEGLKDLAQVPIVPEGLVSGWAQYTLVLEKRQREPLQKYLSSQGIPTVVYYPRPMHMQTAYKKFPRASDNLPVCEDYAERVVSLPMHPYLDSQTQDTIIEKTREGLLHQSIAA